MLVYGHVFAHRVPKQCSQERLFALSSQHLFVYLYSQVLHVHQVTKRGALTLDLPITIIHYLIDLCLCLLSH